MATEPKESKDNKTASEKEELKSVTTPAYTTPKKKKAEKKADASEDSEKTKAPNEEVYADSADALEAFLDGEVVETTPYEAPEVGDEKEELSEESKEALKTIEASATTAEVGKDATTLSSPHLDTTSSADSSAKKWWIIGGISVAGLILLCCCVGFFILAFAESVEY